jgi:putative NADH-flavin reductase
MESKMKLIVFGATGRVGSSFVEQAVSAGHQVTVYVRDAAALNLLGLTIYEGDASDVFAVGRALNDGYDAVVNCIGSRQLKPSTVVRDSYTSIIAGMQAAGIKRLIGVSGTAEMADKTGFGQFYTSILKRTPVGHTVRDHDAALAIVQNSELDWTLVGCNYLKSGPAKGRFTTSLKFPGGFKIIHPPDVAQFMLSELQTQKFNKKVVGIWY